MNGRGRTKGRPQILAGKRIKKIDARFTEDEYALITEMEKALGLTKTELVRQRLLSNAGLLVGNAKELIVLLDQVGAEMGRCGNNINQLAKYANILKKRGIVSPVVIERFNHLFEEYLKNQRALDATLRKVFRMTGA